MWPGRRVVACITTGTGEALVAQGGTSSEANTGQWIGANTRMPRERAAAGSVALLPLHPPPPPPPLPPHTHDEAATLSSPHWHRLAAPATAAFSRSKHQPLHRHQRLLGST